MGLVAHRYDVSVLVSFIGNLGIEAQIILVSGMIIFDILNLAFLLSYLKDINLESAMVLLELVRLIADFPAKIPVH